MIRAAVIAALVALLLVSGCQPDAHRRVNMLVDIRKCRVGDDVFGTFDVDEDEVFFRLFSQQMAPGGRYDRVAEICIVMHTQSDVDLRDELLDMVETE